MEPLNRLKEASTAWRQAVENLDTFHQGLDNEFWGETNQALYLKLHEDVHETRRVYDDAIKAAGL